MRRSFPVFWVVQLVLLLGMGLCCLLSPELVIEVFRGERAPRYIAKPSDELYEWVLGWQEVPAPSERVRQFFQHRHAAMVKAEGRSPGHYAVFRRYTDESLLDRGNKEERDELWEDAAAWILSCRPAPPDMHRPKIEQWIHVVDEFPHASVELCDWVAQLRGAEPPPLEFQLLVLHGKQTLATTWRLAADQVELASSCIFALALFTLFGLISPDIRRPLARCFVLSSLFLTIALLLSSLGPPQWNLTFGLLAGGSILAVAMVTTAMRVFSSITTSWILWIVLSVWWMVIVLQSSQEAHETGTAVGQTSMFVASSILAILGVVNARYWLIGPNEDLPQDNAGIAHGRPPQLWTLWLVQFGVLLVIGLCTMAFPNTMSKLFTTADFDYLNLEIVDDFVRMLGAWIVTLALLSFFSLGVAQDWLWNGIGWIFCIVFSVQALSTMLNVTETGYSFWGYLYGFQGLAYVPFTVLLIMKRKPWSKEIIEKLHWHWSLVDLMFLPLLWQALRYGRRSLYRYGVGACGRMRVLSSPESAAASDEVLPPNAYFRPGHEFSVEARFANFRHADDAALDIRGCALKIWHGSAPPLDLLLATGAYSPFSCLRDLPRFLFLGDLEGNVKKHKVLREGLVAGLRRAPASYGSLIYHSQIVYEWQTPNARHYLVRFRLVPVSPVAAADRGVPDEQDIQQPWLQERRAGEQRPLDYLRWGLQRQIAAGQPLMFHLEAQFHLPCVGDSLDWYDPSLEWDERTHPWLPLAELELAHVLRDPTGESLEFEPGDFPTSLRVSLPERETDIDDPRSLAVAQFRVVIGLGKLRRWRKPPVPAASDAPPPTSERCEASAEAGS